MHWGYELIERFFVNLILDNNLRWLVNLIFAKTNTLPALIFAKQVLFLLSTRMSEKTLNFDSIRVNKKEFRKSKQPIKLDLVNVDQIVVPDKFKHSDGGFKYFIGYKEGEIVKPLCIILPQMSGYIKYFENGFKNMSFVMKDEDLLDKYNEIWDNINNKLNIQFHSMPADDEKYIKAKVRKCNGVIKTNFWGVELRLQIHELRAQIHELWVQIRESRVQIHELQVQIHKLQVQIYKFNNH